MKNANGFDALKAKAEGIKDVKVGFANGEPMRSSFSSADGDNKAEDTYTVKVAFPLIKAVAGSKQGITHNFKVGDIVKISTPTGIASSATAVYPIITAEDGFSMPISPDMIKANLTFSDPATIKDVLGTAKDDISTGVTNVVNKTKAFLSTTVSLGSGMLIGAGLLWLYLSWKKKI